MIRFLMALVFSSLLLSTSFAGDAHAQRNPGSFGIGVGSTLVSSGLSLKSFGGATSMQFTAGCWRSCDGLAASADLLVNLPALFSSEVLALAWNVGIGGAIGSEDDQFGTAVSLVGGIEFNFQALPIDVVLEWRPGLGVLPNRNLEFVEFGGHVRLYVW
ncbi:hypothetical protein FRC98_15775 [Lujinxingia vulgaris]|uniref:Uncharacterized protein n=1 Tax=Lujinxingia vulgaris TaxID=2600176 RepID=A0A5C6XA79_9DELT|nr:hypothetical protein [Lujinxingia vulgaris]TXD35663.1 hypothetical protein FRC98_15775 [Lujinxingia vulgaris]